MKSMKQTLRPLVALVALSACTGNLDAKLATPADGTEGDPATPNDPNQHTSAPSIPEDPTEPLEKRWLDDTASLQPLRRLTAFQIRNAITDLTGVTPSESGLPAEGHRDGFVTFAALQITTDSDLRTLQSLASDVATQVDLAALAGCETTDHACATQLIEQFGKRVFRRPLRSDEIARYQSIYEAGTALGGTDAMRFVIQALLSSPSFLYREMGLDGTTAPYGYRVAEALAFFLWQSVPDEALLEAAASGALDSLAERRAAANEMLEDERAKRAIADFHTQWLRLDQLTQLSPNPETFPEYSDEIASAYREQTLRYAQEAFFGDTNNDFRTLLLGDFTFVNGELSELYGISLPVEGFEKHIAQTPRRGILMQGATLARLSSIDRSEPIYRGDYILEHVLCRELELPGDLNVMLPERDPNKTYRQQIEEITGVGLCNNCHSRINPIGFAIDDFDALGRYRPEENGEAIDTQGEIVGIEDADGSYQDSFEMLELITSSKVAKECYTEKWLQYALGRARREVEDQQSFNSIMATQAESGNRLRSLLVEIAASPAFMPEP